MLKSSPLKIDQNSFLGASENQPKKDHFALIGAENQFAEQADWVGWLGSDAALFLWSVDLQILAPTFMKSFGLKSEMIKRSGAIWPRNTRIYSAGQELS